MESKKTVQPASTNQKSKKKEEKGMSQNTFVVAIGFFSLLCVPFIYQAIQVNAWLQHDLEKGDHEYVKIKDFWIMIVTGVFCVLYEKFIEWLMYDWFYARSKGDNPDEKKFYSKKACRTFY